MVTIGASRQELVKMKREHMLPATLGEARKLEKKLNHTESTRPI